MSTSYRIDTTWISAAMDRLRLAGQNVDRLLTETRLDKVDLSDPDAQVPYLRYSEFFALASEVTDNPCFGMDIGSSALLKDTGLYGYIIEHSPTLYEALVNAVRYLRIHDESTRLEVQSSNGETRIETRYLEHRVKDGRQVYELDQTLNVSSYRELTGNSPPLAKVEFPHSAIGRPDDYRRVFGILPDFNARGCALTLPTAVLHQTNLHSADDKLLKILKAHADNVISRRPNKDDLVGRVDRLVAERLSDGVPRFADIADEMAMSSRTLARRLTERGKSYRAIIDDIRRRLALEYVGDANLRLSEIAFLLGYAEVSAFNHAFRRWTGKTPGDYRP